MHFHDLLLFYNFFLLFWKLFEFSDCRPENFKLDAYLARMQQLSNKPNRFSKYFQLHPARISEEIPEWR